MEWSDRGIILGTRRHGETGLIVEALTYAHGRHLGLVRGGRSTRHRSAYQPGNTVDLTWRARLEDHLGAYTGDMTVARAAAVMDDRLRLACLATAVALGRLLAEREPAPRLAHQLESLLDLVVEEGAWAPGLVRLELSVLGDLGFGLDLTQCALTGATEGLAWVSPKTGRAATREAGARYSNRLLALPGFLLAGEGDGVGDIPASDILDGLRLTGHFLQEHVYGPRAVHPPETRSALVRDLSKI